MSNDPKRFYLATVLDIPFAAARAQMDFPAAPFEVRSGGPREVGAIREATFPEGGRIRERMVSYALSADEWQMSYRILNDDNPLGATGYVGNGRILRDHGDPNRCFMIYESTWDEMAGPVEGLAAMIKGHFAALSADVPGTIEPPQEIHGADGPHRLTHARTIEAPAEAVWAALDYPVSPFEISEAAPREVGAVRSAEMEGMGLIVDRLLAYHADDRRKFFRYALVNEDNAFGARGWRGEMSLYTDTENPGRCFVHYTSIWDEAKISSAELEAQVGGMWEHMASEFAGG